jgi:hypothetical protein
MSADAQVSTSLRWDDALGRLQEHVAEDLAHDL